MDEITQNAIRQINTEINRLDKMRKEAAKISEVAYELHSKRSLYRLLKDLQTEKDQFQRLLEEERLNEEEKLEIIRRNKNKLEQKIVELEQILKQKTFDSKENSQSLRMAEIKEKLYNIQKEENKFSFYATI